jgi:hypothetical protein
MVVGSGAAAWSTVTVYWDGPSGIVLGTVGADLSGNYRLNVTVPTSVQGIHYIVVNDGSGAKHTTFTVNPMVKASTTPSTAEYGGVDAKVLPGESLTLTGTGYAANSPVTIKFDSTTLGTPVSKTLSTPAITTNASGCFSAVVTVPSDITDTQYDAYKVTATDGSTNADDCPVLIDYYINARPAGGPPGITTTFSGRIPANQAYSIVIDTTTVLTGTSGADGQFTQTYTVPALIASGAHTIYVRWVVGSTVSDRDTTFTVTAPPTVTLGATSGIAGTVVTISGSGFSSLAGITLYLDSTVVNSTASDERFGPTTFGGSFSEEFTIPALAPGAYSLTVVDQYGATSVAQTFTINAAPTTTVALRGESYLQGDALSFDIVTTETGTAPLGTITVTIRDPSKVTWWTADWVLPTSGATRRLAYQDQLINGNPIVLPADAPTGTWNWTITYTPTSTGTLTKATGLFTVSAGGIGGVIDAINELKGTIETIKGDVVTIKTSVGTSLATTVSAIQAKVTSIEAGMATISAPNLGSITTSLSNIDAVLGVVAGDTATLKTSLGDVTTSLSAINAKVVSIEGDVASLEGKVVTIQTDVGSLQGVVTQVKDNVATISTGIGNVQTSVSNLQPDVVAAKDNSASISTMVYVAVAFAIIAAIAAVASILLMRKKIAS